MATTAPEGPPAAPAAAPAPSSAPAPAPAPAPAGTGTRPKTGTKPPTKTKTAARTARRKAAEAAALANLTLDEDTVWGPMISEAIAAAGPDAGIVSSAQAEAMITGIPLPALCLRILFGQDVLALGRSIMFVGLPGSLKTALQAEFYRWCLTYKGLPAHIENENKDSPDLRNAILSYDPRFLARLQVEPSDAQQEWMRAIYRWLAKAEARFAKVRRAKPSKKKKTETAEEHKARTGRKLNKTALGWIYPVFLGVDSLTATSSEEEIEKIMEAGAPERGFAIEAQMIAKFARTIPKLIRNRPILLTFTNHLKPGQDSNGLPVDNIPGGWAMRFMDTTEIKMRKLGAEVTVDWAGVRVLISMPKNSLGETGNAIEVMFKWWWEVDPATGRTVQRAVWDWAAASIKALLACRAKSAKTREGIDAVVDLHEASGRKIWSRVLEIPESAPVDYSEAGRRLERRTDLLEALYPVLHIKQRTVFTPGIDFQDLQAQQACQAEARQQTAYEEIDLSAVAFIDEALDDSLRREQEAIRKAKKKAQKARQAGGGR